MTTISCTTDPPSTYRHKVVIRAHELHADAAVADGGEDGAPDAHDYFDASLATCRALTAMWFAKRNNIPLERVESQVERDASEERKGRYRLIVRISFHGDLTDEQRARLHAVAEKCPISKLMTKTEVVIEAAPVG
jgi:putative redox protein